MLSLNPEGPAVQPGSPLLLLDTEHTKSQGPHTSQRSSLLRPERPQAPRVTLSLNRELDAGP